MFWGFGNACGTYATWCRIILLVYVGFLKSSFIESNMRFLHRGMDDKLLPFIDCVGNMCLWDPRVYQCTAKHNWTIDDT